MLITSVNDNNNGVVELTGTWPLGLDLSFLYTCLFILLSFMYNKNILMHFPMLVLQLQLIVTPSGNSVEPLLILGSNQRPQRPWLMVISLWYSLPASIILSFSSLLNLSISPLLSSKVSGPFNGNRLHLLTSSFWRFPDVVPHLHVDTDNYFFCHSFLKIYFNVCFLTLASNQEVEFCFWLHLYQELAFKNKFHLTWYFAHTHSLDIFAKLKQI